MAHVTTDPTLPSYARPEVRAAAEDLLLVHRLLEGTRVMHAHATEYVRKWRDEHPDTYAIRRVAEPVFGGLERTLSAAVGLLFGKPPAITWNGSEAAMRAHWDNLDGAGTKWTVFAKRFAEATIRDGLGVLVVDHPPPPVGEDGQPIPVTAATEAQYDLRPRWARYGRAALLNWRVETIDNQTVPTLLVLAEETDVPDGLFGVRTVDRYRVLQLVPTSDGWAATWTLYQRAPAAAGEQADTYREIGRGAFRDRAGRPARRLPVAIAYAGRTEAPCTASIPLLGVAWANLAHWQIATDLRFARSVCGFEQLVVTGQLMPDETTGAAGKLKIGPLVGIHVEQGGSVQWASPPGHGLAQLAEGRKEKLVEMAQLGLSFLQPDTRAAETAEAKRLDATAENATLATAAQGIEDAINAAAEIDAWYRDIPAAQAPVIAIAREFEALDMPAPLLLAWVRAIADAGLPPRLMLEQMQSRGLIAPDADLEEIELEMLAGQAARADANEEAVDRARAERLVA
jgi:hypothetical protein